MLFVDYHTLGIVYKPTPFVKKEVDQTESEKDQSSEDREAQEEAPMIKYEITGFMDESLLPNEILEEDALPQPVEIQQPPKLESVDS